MILNSTGNFTSMRLSLLWLNLKIVSLTFGTNERQRSEERQKQGDSETDRKSEMGHLRGKDKASATDSQWGKWVGDKDEETAKDRHRGRETEMRREKGKESLEKDGGEQEKA